MSAQPRPPLRRLRLAAPWVALALAAALLATLLSGAPSGERLGADNPGRQGGRALARVLAEQGVDVAPVAGAASLLDRPVGPGTTVLLTGTEYLDEQVGTELVAHLAAADRLVVVVPEGSLPPGPALGLDVAATDAGGGPPREPDCQDPLTRPGDLLLRWDVQLEATGDDRSAVSACYPPGRGHGAGGAREGALLSFPAAADRPQTVLVGLGSALSNAHVTEGAHAALGLRLLGASPQLLWVAPRPGDAAHGAPTSLWHALPRSTTPAVAVLGAAVLALALWRGRRLGPVVTEPLPALVHAAETTRNRGRLYRQARDRPHALAALREGTRRRLAPRLGLPATTDARTLSRAVAEATGRPLEQVQRQLEGPLADDDATLAATAAELRSLEEGLHP